MTPLRWKRTVDHWSAQIEPGRIARIHANQIGARARNYTVTIGLNNYGEVNALAAAKLVAMLAAHRRIRPIIAAASGCA